MSQECKIRNAYVSDYNRFSCLNLGGLSAPVLLFLTFFFEPFCCWKDRQLSTRSVRSDWGGGGENTINLEILLHTCMIIRNYTCT